MNLEQGINTFDLFGFVRRRGKLIAIAAGGVILVTFWITMALPNLYESAAVILVEPQSVDEKLVDSGVRDGDLNEKLDLMSAEILSRSRLSKIITEKISTGPEEARQGPSEDQSPITASEAIIQPR